MSGVRGTWLVAAVFGTVLATAPLGPAAAAAADPAASAQPRVEELRPRTAGLAPRVAGLKPRVVDLRPKRHRNTLTVGSDVLFAFDSARLSTDAASVLAGVVRDLRTAHARRVVIVGYTDSIGSDAYNQRLSERRARTVLAYLRTHAGGKGVRYAAAGRGEQDPVAANTRPDGSDDPDGRRKNRRVTITYPQK